MDGSRDEYFGVRGKCKERDIGGKKERQIRDLDKNIEGEREREIGTERGGKHSMSRRNRSREREI